MACCNPQRHRCMSAVNVSFGSGCVGVIVKLRTMNTNSALGEKYDEDVFDASNQWCPLLELCFRHTVGRVLVKALGVDSAMRLSETCMFAMLIHRNQAQSACVTFPDDLHAATSDGCTRGDGARSCPIRSSTLQSRYS